MDIQMPGMDGLEVTKTLREKGVETPIVALTAYAMKGDDKRCIAAGCNGYLSKLLDRRRLLEKVYQYLSQADDSPCEKAESINSEIDERIEHHSGRASQEGGDKEDSNGNQNPIMNWDRLIGRLGDEELIREVVPIFLKDNKERLETLEEAVKAADAEAVKLYAHAIKGAGRNVGAQSLSEVAHEMECAGGEGDIEACIALFDSVKTELEKVMTFLSSPDWIEVVKREKIVTDDFLHAAAASS